MIETQYSTPSTQFELATSSRPPVAVSPTFSVPREVVTKYEVELANEPITELISKKD